MDQRTGDVVRPRLKARGPAQLPALPIGHAGSVYHMNPWIHTQKSGVLLVKIFAQGLRKIRSFLTDLRRA